MVIKHNGMVINSSDKTCKYLPFTVLKTSSLLRDLHCPQPGGNPALISLLSARKGASFQDLPLDRVGRGQCFLIKGCFLETPPQPDCEHTTNEWISNNHFKARTKELI